MPNWCVWIWKWVLWRELLRSCCGQKSLLARARSTFPKHVVGRAGLSDVVQASDLSNKALLPQPSRLQMAIKPGVKFYLRSLMGTLKPPSNSSVVPMKAFRKRPQCPKIFVACGPSSRAVSPAGRDLAHLPWLALRWHSCLGWMLLSSSPRPVCNCTCWRTAGREQKYGLGGLLQKEASNAGITTLIIHGTVSFLLLRGKDTI